MSNPEATPEAVVHRDTVPGGRYWSMVIRRGFTLRLLDRDGRANVAMLLYNPRNPLERYNMADTLKGQHTSRLTRGNMLYSDMGRVMMSIVEDTAGWHDTIGGITRDADIARKYGEHRYQAYGNDFYRSGRELFLVELAKWGLGKRDLVANLNLFSKVYAGADGVLHFDPENSGPGDSIDLRAEMDTLVVLNTAPHPMDPAPDYAPGPVDLVIYRSPPVLEDDYCVNLRPENARAFANTAIHNCQG
ncbi:MAG: urea carboxylase-associated family protein [Thioalkalivibrio sp.]|nr:MAG: urea carboxylase-associated family protein [Thioalkalivibrio sp.]